MLLFFSSSVGVYALRMVSPSHGLFVPVGWASAAHAMGIGSPCVGQLLPIVRAMSAQTFGLFLGNILWLFAMF